MEYTTLCYIEQDSKYLMIHRTKRKGDGNDDKWIGIGGHFEENESPFDCVMREAREETGLTLIKPKYRGIVTFVSDIYETNYMHLFTCGKYEGEIAPCPEGELEWVEKSRLRELPLWEGDHIFLKLLDTHPEFFSLKLIYKGDTLVGHILYD